MYDLANISLTMPDESMEKMLGDWIAKHADAVNNMMHNVNNCSDIVGVIDAYRPLLNVLRVIKVGYTSIQLAYDLMMSSQLDDILKHLLNKRVFLVYNYAGESIIASTQLYRIDAQSLRFTADGVTHIVVTRNLFIRIDTTVETPVIYVTDDDEVEEDDDDDSGYEDDDDEYDDFND